MFITEQMKALDVLIAEAKGRLQKVKENWLEMHTADAIAAFGKIEAEIRELKRKRHALYPRSRINT